VNTSGLEPPTSDVDQPAGSLQPHLCPDVVCPLEGLAQAGQAALEAGDLDGAAAHRQAYQDHYRRWHQVM